MNQNNYFFGFSTFEEFLAASPTKQIYLTKSIASVPDVMNLTLRTWQITAATIVGGICHYWRMTVGGDRIFGEPFPEEKKYADACEERAASLQRELSEICRDNQYSVIHALLTLPKDLVVLKGTVTSLEYDKDKNSFKRKLKPLSEPETEQEKLAA